MKRTQVYLPEELHAAVRRISYEEHKSMAQVVRDAVAAHVTRGPTASRETWDKAVVNLGTRPDATSHPTDADAEDSENNPLYEIIALAGDREDGDDAEDGDEKPHPTGR